MSINTGMFPDTIITNAGKQMIVESQNGATLKFTRVALGDGVLGDNEDEMELTALKNEKLSVNISSFKDLGTGQFTLTFTIDNSQVEKGFWHREIGIMASVNGGAEKLYAYTNAGSAASFLYNKTTPVQARTVKIDFVVGSAENVEIVVDKSIVYATQNDLSKHDADENAHAELLNKINNSLIKENNLYHAESTGYGIVSGCEPSIDGLTVTVSAGVIHTADGRRIEVPEQSITLDAADATKPRTDVVYLDTNGALAKITGTGVVTAGTATTSTAIKTTTPSIDAHSILIGSILVQANGTSLSDTRMMLMRYHNTGVVNVKDFGATGDGITDDTKAMQTAFRVAVSNNAIVLIPPGIYTCTGTLSSAHILFCGGMLTGPITFDDCYIIDTKQQIFKDAVLTGYLMNDEIYPEWFGAKAISVKKDSISQYHDAVKDSSDAIQAAIDFVNVKKYGGNRVCNQTVKLGPGLYRIDKTIDNYTYGKSAQIIGAGIEATILDFSELKNAECIKMGNGIGGTSNKGTIGHFHIYADSTDTLLSMTDCLGYVVDRVHFSTGGIGVLFCNDIKGSYSEQNKITNCYFDYNCVVKGQYKKVNGDASFHGTGFKNCYCEHNLSKNPMIIIDSGCSPYNAELEFNVMAMGDVHTYPLIKNSGYNVNMTGYLKIEGSTLAKTTLASGNAFYFSGPITLWGGGAKLGSVKRMNSFVGLSGGADIDPLPEKYQFVFDGAKTITAGASGGYLYAVEVFADNYAYRALIVSYTEYNEYFLNAYSVLNTKLITDSNGYGTPTFSTNGNGDLTITPSSSLPTSARLYVRKMMLGVDRRNNNLCYA